MRDKNYFGTQILKNSQVRDRGCFQNVKTFIKKDF